MPRLPEESAGAKAPAWRLRWPLPSLRMLAVTPAPAELILSRIAASVSVASIVTATGVLPLAALWRVSVPAPSVAVLEATAGAAMVCALARLLTCTL